MKALNCMVAIVPIFLSRAYSQTLHVENGFCFSSMRNTHVGVRIKLLPVVAQIDMGTKRTSYEHK